MHNESRKKDALFGFEEWKVQGQTRKKNVYWYLTCTRWCIYNAASLATKPPINSFFHANYNIYVDERQTAGGDKTLQITAMAFYSAEFIFLIL